MVLLVFTLVGVQFWRVIDENIAMASELHGVSSDIANLRKRHDDELRELRRLQDPDGAIPEIHDRLRLVKPNEAMIFVSPAPASVQ